ncbi:aminotransferase, partial [Streptomyces nigra]
LPGHGGAITRHEGKLTTDRPGASHALLAGLEAFAPVGLRVAGPAEASFVLVRLPDATAVRGALRAQGYAVRRGDTFPGLDAEWLRLAVRDRATTDGFLRALSRVLASA